MRALQEAGGEDQPREPFRALQRQAMGQRAGEGFAEQHEGCRSQLFLQREGQGVMILPALAWQFDHLAGNIGQLRQQRREQPAAAVQARQQHQVYQLSPASLRSCWNFQRT